MGKRTLEEMQQWIVTYRMPSLHEALIGGDDSNVKMYEKFVVVGTSGCLLLAQWDNQREGVIPEPLSENAQKILALINDALTRQPVIADRVLKGWFSDMINYLKERGAYPLG